MKIARGAGLSNAVKLLWLGAVLVLLAGYVFVHRSFEIRIAEQIAESETIALALDRNEVVLRGRSALERQQHRFEAVLGSVDLHAEHSALVARFIHEAVRIGNEHRVRVVQIDGARGGPATLYSPPAADESAASADRPLFDTVLLEVTLEGMYLDVLSAMRELSRMRVLVQVDIAAIERITASQESGPLVTAHLHVAVERLLDRPTPGSRVLTRGMHARTEST